MNVSGGGLHFSGVDIETEVRVLQVNLKRLAALLCIRQELKSVQK